MAGFNTMELMIAIASRQLEDGATVLVGTGAPCAAAMLAQRVHSPHIVILFEAGGIAPILPTMPISVGDSRTFRKGLLASGMCEVMESIQRGMIDYVFLGGAQIDPFGNLNATQIGSDHDHPDVRLPGSGGANDLASFAWRTMVVTPQDRRRFVPTLDFVTTPGYLSGPGAREAAGLPAGTGPHKVVTNLGILGYDPVTKRMRAESLHPGVTRDDVIANTGFPLEFAAPLAETAPPTDDELRILREEVDPRRYIIGR